ncbi:rod shape-determining protein RodA [Candidatus Woesebacteria bacterium]|nr:rod shape-determining protein RodA [Candidatus Woesebacteria bacterium]
MKRFFDLLSKDYFIVIPVVLLIVISVFTLRSLAPEIFPSYLLFILAGLVLFIFSSALDFEIYYAFSKHFYILSIFFLALPLIIGQVTRGSIRWINLGDLTIQPSEIIRPFLILYVARFLTQENIDLKRLFKLLFTMALPLFMILVQPSLGVTVLTFFGFLGAMLATSIEKKYFALGAVIFIAIMPIVWHILEPYQRERVTSFINPEADPYGSGYNSIQSMISVGSGGLLGRGLGLGVQTQLKFLPEKHSDFVFAAISEEMGFVGACFILFLYYLIFAYIVRSINNSRSYVARVFGTGLFMTYFVQVVIHIGMNMGMFPITGVPLPLVSAGGSSFISTMLGLGLLVSANKRS